MNALKMRKASWLLLLHCHLPFVRHPEHGEFLEENWLFEAITETYLPLIEGFDRLLAEGVEFKITVSLSPTLCEMLADELLQRRCAAYMEKRVKLCEKELSRLGGTDYESAVAFYDRRFRRQLERYGEKAGEAVLHGMRRLKERGVVELITSAATHALLPIIRTPAAAAAQIEMGCRCFEKHLGERPRGLWLPECAYSAEIAPLLLDAGIQYSFLESHGALLADPPPARGVFSPLTTPEGLVFFARDPQSSKQVWSGDEGYPGDPLYREFYRDIGFDAPYEHVRPFLHPTGDRHQLGLKYHRITGERTEKRPYDPKAARNRAEDHARHFVCQRDRQIRALSGHMDGAAPVIVSPYDAELFGHWWLEGPWFLQKILQEMGRGDGRVRTVAPMDCLARTGEMQVVSPASSTWGYQGYYDIWVNSENDWIYRHLAMGEEKIARLADSCRDADELLQRGVKQCIREFMLAQASDWPFQIGVGSARKYATRRVKDHLANFGELAKQLEAGAVVTTALQEMEWRHNIFAELECDIYR